MSALVWIIRSSCFNCCQMTKQLNRNYFPDSTTILCLFRMHCIEDFIKGLLLQANDGLSLVLYIRAKLVKEKKKASIKSGNYKKAFNFTQSISLECLFFVLSFHHLYGRNDYSQTGAASLLEANAKDCFWQCSLEKKIWQTLQEWRIIKTLLIFHLSSFSACSLSYFLTTILLFFKHQYST